jgi:GNAT superfamily N-acetyltransferase
MPARGGEAVLTAPGPLSIQAACLADAAEILALQKVAYLSEAAIYDDYSIPPLHQTLPEMIRDMEAHCYLKAELAGRIAGSVRGRLEGGTCYVGRLIVAPEVQNRGIGTQLLKALEACFPGAERFELFTGEASAKNLYLYRKLGYQAFRSEPLTDRVTLVYLEKRP